MGFNSRNDDPHTSHDAEDLLADVQGRHVAIIYQELARNGPGTQSELARRTGLRPDQVWRRFSDLERYGLIEYTGIDRLGDSDRFQRVMGLREKRQPPRQPVALQPTPPQPPDKGQLKFWG